MAQKRQSSMNASKIIGIQFSVLSPEEIRKGSVAEITSRDTYINNKPVINGLFDPRMGVLEPGLVCPTDGLNYMETPGYFGHIEMARPVYYIQYLTTILKVLRCICFKCSKLKMNKELHKHILKLGLRQRWDYAFKNASKVKRCGDETSDGCGCTQPRKIYKQDLANLYAEWANPDKIPGVDGIVKDKLTMKLTPEMVLKIFRRISDEDVAFMGFSPIWSRPDWFICQVLAIPPPAVRPSVKHDSQQRSEDDISHIIVNIIKANKTLLDKLQSDASEKVIEDWTTVLQYYVATMIDNRIPGVAAVAQRSGRALKSIKERLVGKGGRVRGNLMGKRVDFSARSVITPDANIGIRDLGVPIKIAMNITFPMCVNDRNKAFLTKLVLNGPTTYPGANVLDRKSGESVSLKYVDRNTLTLNNGDIVHRHMLDGDPVLFNRQPTLHRMSMMCHIAKVMKVGNTFRMNVADTKPYNADFDGDEMNLHQPQDEESQAELMYLAAVPLQIVSPQNNSSIVGIFQDSLLGCTRFTRENINFDTRHAMNLLMYFDNVNPSLFADTSKRVTSFEILSQILPPLSTKMENGVYGEKEEDYKTSNNIIEIINGEYKRGQLDKGALGKGSKGLIQTIFNDFNYKESANFIDNVQSIITEYMKLSSYSVGISDLIADDETNSKIISAVNTKKKDVENLIDQLHLGVFENSTGKTNEIEFETKVNALLNAAAKDASKIGRTSLSEDNRFVIMVNSGSKGNALNIAQMVSCVGQQNVDGKRIPYGFEDRTLPHFTKFNDGPAARGFVESSFIQGLTPEEVYFHAMGGRVGLIDTAVKTSQTGYIQRRLIKGQEDLKVAYDMTVRNNKNKVIQFQYGDDHINPMKTENQSIQLPEMTLEDIYSHMAIPEDDSSKSIFTTTYDASTLKRMKSQKKKLQVRTNKLIADMIEYRSQLINNVFKYEKNTVVHIPVHFKRIINNIQHQLNIQSNFVVNITPLEMYELIDDAFETLSAHKLSKPTELFKLAWYFYLTPKELLMVRRYNRKAMVVLMESLMLNYHKAIVHPGEMVGMVSAQSIGEPTTQMSKLYESVNALIKVERQGKNVKVSHKKYKIGELCDSFIEKYPQYTFPTGHPDSVETLLDKLDEEYYIMGVGENEKTSWSKISHFSRHPVNGDMMTITTKSGRTVTTTLSHSHLTRKDHKVQPIKGSDLEIGMRIPVCKHIDNEFVNKTVEIGDKTYNLDKLFGWFIGAYIAEGSCSGNRIRITNISQHYIDMTTIIGEMFGSKVKIDRTPGEYGPGATTSFGCKELAKFLVKECGPNSFEKKVPSFIFTAPLECKASCIQGYMDGDGNINCGKGHHEIRGCSRSHQLIKDMGLLFNYFDIFATFRENVRQKKPFYHFAISNGYSNLYQKHIGSVLKEDKLQEMCEYNTRANAHSLSNDVDKIEGLGEIIAKCGKDLKLPGQSRNYGRWKKKKTIGRRTLQKYIKVFKEAIGETRVLQDEMEILEQAATSGIIWDEIKHIEIYTPDQKEYVYDFTVPANQTFMEDNGVIVHNTLNTFHFAGVASKVGTRGVPRIEEILSLSENPKQPSTTIYLKPSEQTDLERAQEIKYSLEYTSIRDIAKSVSICFDPQPHETLIDEDKLLIDEYMQFNKIMEECGAVDEELQTGAEQSKWIIRIELSKEEIMDRNISMADIHFALTTSLKHQVECVFSDLNANNLVFRIRLVNSKAMMNSKKKGLDQTDEIYMLKNLQENILDNIILKGIKGIPKLTIRTIKNYMVEKDGNFVPEDIWVLDTVGSNLKEILAIDYIDTKRTYSNDIQEVYRTLGIEAARECIYTELSEAFSDTTYINYHHMSMLCDRMCATQKMVSIFRHGINNDDIGPIAKASFEETPEMFLKAARHAELDLMTGVSANIMCGQQGYYGTGSFQVLLNIDEMTKLGSAALQQTVDIADLLQMENPNDVCSKKNIEINSSTSYINGNDTGNIDDNYELDF
jgi:DNA-directed RNA polymerase II subunit RPB1